MKLADTLSTTTTTTIKPPISPPVKKGESMKLTTLFNNIISSSKIRHKFWLLAALLLLAVWSMFTGTVTLKFSAANLIHTALGADHLTSYSGSTITIVDDVDVLELAEREKFVRQMWNLYSFGAAAGTGNKVPLPRFWHQAFQAAYDGLISDSSEVRDSAVTEIAKMSFQSIELLGFPDHSTLVNTL